MSSQMNSPPVRRQLLPQHQHFHDTEFRAQIQTSTMNISMDSPNPNHRRRLSKRFSNTMDDSMHQQTGSSSSELPAASSTSSVKGQGYTDGSRSKYRNNGISATVGVSGYHLASWKKSPLFYVTLVFVSVYLLSAFQNKNKEWDAERTMLLTVPINGAPAVVPVFTYRNDRSSNLHSIMALTNPHPLYTHDPRAYLSNAENIKSCTNGVHDVDEVISKLDQFKSFNFSSELYKFCVLYNSGGVYLDADGIVFVQRTLDDVLQSFGERYQGYGIVNHAEESMHGAMIAFDQPKCEVFRQMIQFLLSANVKKLDKNPSFISKRLYQFVQEEAVHGSKKWKLLDQQCHTSSGSLHCRDLHGMCCRVFNPDDAEDVLMLSNKGVQMDLPHLQSLVLPYSHQNNDERRTQLNVMRGNGNQNVSDLSNPLSEKLQKELPFISTLRETVHLPPPSDFGETPNMFEILLRNDCLPTKKECATCLRNKKGATCETCAMHCQCFCESLCQIDVPAKHVRKTITITPPTFSVDPSRHIPRIVHQTWFEKVDKLKYKNMSRLIESWKQSGWEYKFYDDEAIVEFLQAHFPSEVLEAYNAIIPGAFKADLFRYCVLLIYGGIYVDVDVMLESNLDSVIDPDIGFMIAIDEPGKLAEKRMCLWNGLLAVAPGHPFMAKVIELVVNNIRNRFTSVDMDAALCPNPELSVSHAFDTLFTAGPCIMGAAVNSVIGRHKQTQFVIGELSISNRRSEEVSTQWDGSEWNIPGRSIFLEQNKEDMGAHRFTFVSKNIVVAATDLPEYDDQQQNKKKHYSETHVKYGVYGMDMLYNDQHKANEEVRFVVGQ